MKTAQLRTSLRKTASVSVLALAGTFLTTPAQAQGIPTFDSAAFMQAIVQYSAQVAEYATQAERWSETVMQYQQQLAHYQQMVASVLNLNFSAKPTATLQRVTDIPGMVAQACPSPGGVVDTALSIVGLTSLNLNGSIAANQQAICQKITLLQIDKYNKTADMLESMKQYTGLLQQIDQLRSSLSMATSIGDLQANTNEAARSANKLNKEMSDWQGQMQANDAAIATLQAQQSILANIALKGKSSAIGEIVQAGAFAAAFDN